jgi:hypothetical protein
MVPRYIGNDEAVLAFALEMNLIVDHEGEELYPGRTLCQCWAAL